MRKLDDLSGKIFGDGMVAVLRRAPSDKNRKSRWVCQCKWCGNTFVTYGYSLKAGITKSCGCINKTELGEEQMKRPSISLYRLKKDNTDPYQNLANAIVAVAADDYREAVELGDEKLIESLEDFFYSDWYRMLTNVKPNKLLSLLRKEVNHELNVFYT